MLVHVCCAVDCDYFLRRLQDQSDEKLICYFYDPNIHPIEEYELRFLDAKRVCDNLNIKIVKAKYDYETWLNGTKGLENEPEKGRRCEFCFDFRMQNTACFARSIGEQKITTTLLMSPKKSHAQLVNSLEKICKEQNLEFVAPDFRKNGGTNEQFSLAKKDRLYHQNYCGCMFALQAQRNGGNFFTNSSFLPSVIPEFFSALNRQILPGSPSKRLKFYKKVIDLEKKGEKFEILRDEFLNYRLLQGVVKFDDKAIKSHILFNSHFKRQNLKFFIKEGGETFFSDKNEIKILSLDFFNKLAKTRYKNMNELLKNPPRIQRENLIRAKLVANGSLSPIIIVEKIYPCKVEITAVSHLYLDVREILVRIS